MPRVAALLAAGRGAALRRLRPGAEPRPSARPRASSRMPARRPGTKKGVFSREDVRSGFRRKTHTPGFAARRCARQRARGAGSIRGSGCTRTAVAGLGTGDASLDPVRIWCSGLSWRPRHQPQQSLTRPHPPGKPRRHRWGRRHSTARLGERLVRAAPVVECEVQANPTRYILSCLRVITISGLKN
jgi:hypothetical protein